MKIASYKINGKSSYGIATDAGMIDLASRLGDTAPTLKDLIAVGLEQAERIAETESPDFPIDSVELEPVIPNPGAVWCTGLNTHSHFHEASALMGVRELPKVPMFFLRSVHTLVGSGQPIEKPKLETDFDYEGEIALVIGKSCRNVSVEDAMDYVAGYACFNDGSARQYQIRSHQVTTGKNAYHSGGFGPWLLTADAIKMEDFSLETRVNGEVRQSMKIDDLIFSMPELISHISEVTWLKPGDVIVTGSAEGAGALRNPQVFLKEGDVVEIEIEGLGTLSNPIVEQVI